MKFVLTFCFYFFVRAITDDIVKEEGVPRVIGGAVCRTQDHRFVVSIRNRYKKHICGGTLLDQYWVLTAAHCVCKDPMVFAGLNFLTGFTMYTAARVVDVFPHPDYDKIIMDNDIALFRIDFPLAVDDHFIQYVKLPSEVSSGDVSEHCQEGVLMGWGVTNVSQGQVSHTLQCVLLPLIRNEQCSELYKQKYTVTQNMVCTLSAKKQDACQGDSGGPLMCNNTQIAIVSWGLDCATKYPGVYTRIDKYLDFIKRTTTTYRSGRSTGSSTLSVAYSSFSFALTIYNLLI